MIQNCLLLSKSESVTNSPVKKYISLLNQLIFTEAIRGILLIYRNLSLAI